LEIDQWDIESGSAVGAPMKGHTVGVNSIAYGPGGDYLVSAGSDGTLRFWDTTTGRQLGDPIVMPGEQQSVEVSHDGRRIFINEAALLTSGGHSSRVLEVPAPAAWRDKLCDKLPRNPSEEQWKQWVSPDVPYTEICPGKS
jgi:WD40 repeat protein